MDPTRRRAGIALFVASEVLLLAAVAWAAWSPNDNPSYPPLGFADFLGAVVLVGGVCSAFLVPGALVVATGKKWFSVVFCALMVGVAGFLGFVGSALVVFGRCTTCDDA